MSEWFKVYVSKTYVGVFLPWVQIPLSSPKKGENMERKKFLRKNIIIFIIAVITIIVASVIIKYQVEGEIDIPFQVSKVMVISNAYGIQEDDKENWNLKLVQNNDIYIDILKNKNYTEKEIIDKVILDNFEMDQKPKKGKSVIYNSRKFRKWCIL